MKRFGSVVLGGTFDRLHRGHKALLTKAFEVGDHVTIGLTTDHYVRTVKQKHLEIQHSLSIDHCSLNICSYKKRNQDLRLWLESEGYIGRFTIVSLKDLYAPAVVNGQKAQYDAIVVSTETRRGALEINRVRKQKGQKDLIIVEILMVPAEDEHHISSTRIRAGEIDREGDLVLPKSLRKVMREPIGTLIPHNRIVSEIVRDGGAQIVCVGDSTTHLFLTLGMRPVLSIIDFSVERHPYEWDKKTYDVLREHAVVDYIKSGPGSISSEAMRVIGKWGKALQACLSARQGVTLHGAPGHTVLIVDGEEDLLVLPVLLSAPLGTIVYYGQPSEGAVRVVVTEEKKQRARMLLRKFTSNKH